MKVNDSQCGLCRRNLLTGERPLFFADSRSGALVLVCALCVERAEKNGWQLQEDAPSTVVGSEDPERTVRLMQARADTLQHQLEDTISTLEGTREHTSEREIEIETLAARLADAETEGAAVRAALAETERRLGQVEHELDESRAAQTAILRARRREADEVYLANIAAEVFNRSPQAATIGLLVGLHGTPSVRLDVGGGTLPRQVQIAFGWPAGGRDYRVDIDLVARRFDLVDLVPGSDGRLIQRDQPLYGNADWVEGRIVTAPAEPTLL